MPKTGPDDASRPSAPFAGPNGPEHSYGEIKTHQRALRHPGRHQSERLADFDRNSVADIKSECPADIIGMPNKLAKCRLKFLPDCGVVHMAAAARGPYWLYRIRSRP
jgi:hypothetical protein